MKPLPLLALALVAGCPAPDTSPATVRALDLARFYREDPATASRAYDGKPVLLALTNPVAAGSELHWHLTGSDAPAVVVCRFDGPAPQSARVVWVAGTCRGLVHDGREREFSGYDFYVVVTDCRPSPPPTTRRP